LKPSVAFSSCASENVFTDAAQVATVENIDADAELIKLVDIDLPPVYYTVSYCHKKQ
jgi:hypothetical protein